MICKVDVKKRKYLTGSRQGELSDTAFDFQTQKVQEMHPINHG